MEPTTYAGTYFGAIRAVAAEGSRPTPGAFRMVVDDENRVRVTVHDRNTSAFFDLEGTVDAGGQVSVGGQGGASRMFGRITGGRVRGGTWSNSSAKTSGVWYAEIEGADERNLFSTNRTTVVEITSARVGEALQVLTGSGWKHGYHMGRQVSKTLLAEWMREAFGLQVLPPYAERQVTLLIYGSGAPEGSEGDRDMLPFIEPGPSDGEIMVWICATRMDAYFVPREMIGLSVPFVELVTPEPAGSARFSANASFIRSVPGQPGCPLPRP